MSVFDLFRAKRAAARAEKDLRRVKDAQLRYSRKRLDRIEDINKRIARQKARMREENRKTMANIKAIKAATEQAVNEMVAKLDGPMYKDGAVSFDFQEFVKSPKNRLTAEGRRIQEIAHAMIKKSDLRIAEESEKLKNLQIRTNKEILKNIDKAIKEKNKFDNKLANTENPTEEFMIDYEYVADKATTAAYAKAEVERDLENLQKLPSLKDKVTPENIEALKNFGSKEVYNTLPAIGIEKEDFDKAVEQGQQTYAENVRNYAEQQRKKPEEDKVMNLANQFVEDEMPITNPNNEYELDIRSSLKLGLQDSDKALDVIGTFYRNIEEILDMEAKASFSETYGNRLNQVWEEIKKVIEDRVSELGSNNVAAAIIQLTARGTLGDLNRVYTEYNTDGDSIGATISLLKTVLDTFRGIKGDYTINYRIDDLNNYTEEEREEMYR